jgi:hypothetical protein
VCTLRNRFSRHKWWKADGGAGVGLSWRTVTGYPASCHEDEEKGKFPSGRHFYYASFSKNTGSERSFSFFSVLSLQRILIRHVAASNEEEPCTVLCTEFRKIKRGIQDAIHICKGGWLLF